MQEHGRLGESGREVGHRCRPLQDLYAKNGLPSPLENAYDNPEDTGGLEALLRVTAKARVMLRHNLDVADGLVNGATGWVDSLDFDAEGVRVVAIWVRFDAGGGRWMQAHAATTVRIQPRHAHFFGKLDQEKVRRVSISVA